MTNQTRFTDKFISNLKPEPKERWIREGQGFAIRVLPSGERVWYYIYTFDARKRYMRLGSYPDVTLATAREAFHTARVKVKNGTDPMAEKLQAETQRAMAPTVAGLVTEYIERYAKKFKKSWEADERLLQKEIIPLWGTRKAADITKRDVTVLLENIVDRGAPGMSNQVLKITRKMFNFAIERDILHHTPFTGVKALAPTTHRERSLSEKEIEKFWENLREAAVMPQIRLALQLILVTAQRPGEVAGMHTSEIDSTWWTIPRERAKNGKPHRIPLSPLAQQIIEEAIADNRATREVPETEKYTGYIFPTPHRAKDKPIERHAMSKALKRNASKDGKVLGVAPFTPHDLRRTAATFLAAAGEMDEVIDAVLSHSKQGIIRVYNQFKYDAQKQAALEAWGRKLENMLGTS